MATARALETCRTGRPEGKFCKVKGVKPTELQWQKMASSRAKFDGKPGAVENLHSAMITPEETASIPLASEGIAPGTLVVKLGHLDEMSGRKAAEVINTDAGNVIWREYDAQIQEEVDASWALRDKASIVEGMIAWGVSPEDLGNIDAEPEEPEDIHTLIARGDEGMVSDGLVPPLEDNVVSLEALKGANTSRADQEAVEDSDSEGSVAWLEAHATERLLGSITRSPAVVENVVSVPDEFVVNATAAYADRRSIAPDNWVRRVPSDDQDTSARIALDRITSTQGIGHFHPDSATDAFSAMVEIEEELYGRQD